MTIPQYSDYTIRILRDFFKISLEYLSNGDITRYCLYSEIILSVEVSPFSSAHKLSSDPHSKEI